MTATLNLTRSEILAFRRRAAALDERLPRGQRALRRNVEDPLKLVIEVEREADGRWLAEVPELPGVLSYGQTRPEAIARVQPLALRVLADRLEHGESTPDLLSVSFQAA